MARRQSFQTVKNLLGQERHREYRGTSGGNRSGLQRYNRLLNRAEQDPSLLLRDKRCHNAEVCLAFIDRCNQRALDPTLDAREHGRMVVELAERLDETHLVNLARGAQVHAWVDRGELPLAERLLEQYRAAADGCCLECLSDWLWRLGDLMVETRRPVRALKMIDRAISTRGDALDADTHSRFLFIRALALHLLGADRAALEDAGSVLQGLALDSPRGYFADTLAFMACFLERDTTLDERALLHLERFRERSKGLGGWRDVRVRRRWVEGLIHGRQGDSRRAIDRLNHTRKALLDSGPVYHAVAATLDLCQVFARVPNQYSVHSVSRQIESCLHRTPSKKARGAGWSELEPDLRRGLERILLGLRMGSELLLVELVELRRSFTAVVPGILGPVLLDDYLLDGTPGSR